MPFIALIAWLMLTAPADASAEIAVIVNPGSGVEQLTRDEVINIYMGRFQGFPTGVTAFPVDLHSIKADFYSGLVDKSLSEVNSYWARLVFSGRASPPRQLGSVSEILDVVASNKGAIGYVPSGELAGNEQVRVVYELAP